MSHIIILPIAVPVTKKGKLWYLNLNQYRNTHYQTLNKAKREFKDQIAEQVLKLPFFEQVAITFTFYPGKGIIPDTSNVCCVADKFFCDALVELSKLKDDNRKFVLGTQYLPGEKDIHNPRVEAKIHDHSKGSQK